MRNRKPDNRLVLLGDAGVGKTRMLNQLQGKPDTQTKPTRGAEYFYQPVLTDDESFLLEAIDVTGESRFRRYISLYLKEGCYVWFVCNAGSIESLESIQEKWLYEVNRLAPDARLALLVWHENDAKPILSERAIRSAAESLQISPDCCYDVHLNDKQALKEIFKDFYQKVTPPQNESSEEGSFSLNKFKVTNSFSGFFKRHGKKIIFGCLFALGLAIAAYFMWPLMLGLLAGAFVEAAPWMLIAGLVSATTVSGLFLSWLGGYAVDKSISACLLQPKKSTSSIMAEFSRNDRLPKVRFLNRSQHIKLNEEDEENEEDRSSEEQDLEGLVQQLLIEEYPLIDDNNQQNYSSLKRK